VEIILGTAETTFCIRMNHICLSVDKAVKKQNNKQQRTAGFKMKWVFQPNEKKEEH